MKPNIVFILADAVRARNIGCYGFDDITPNIDSLAGEGVMFEDAYSCINATDPSLTTIFSGKYPRGHGMLDHGILVTEKSLQRLAESGTALLPELLKGMGYRTLAVDWLGRWHRRGYDHYEGIREMSSEGMDVIERADTVSDRAIHLMEENKKHPFFLFLHYWDTHMPYDPPRENIPEIPSEELAIEALDSIRSKHYREKMKRIVSDAGGFKNMVSRYYGTINFVDQEMGRLIERMKDIGLYDDSIIVFTSDHGESLTEHGIFFDHHGLYDVSIHVPLILKYPGSPKGREVPGFVQHFDLMPTILDLLERPQNGMLDFNGKTMLPLINDLDPLHSAVHAEEHQTQHKVAVRTKDFKYIRALSPKGNRCRYCEVEHSETEELYDLKKDPGETENITGEREDVKEELAGIQREYLKSFEKATANSDKWDIQKILGKLKTSI
ncbi:MAG: sulfatase-like hydrolase/transferase [Candidatus Altiarchaeales archaeon]|nr:sulfatase-like hydrolase/transferase [Candidatus Altiarchaeales archaeon]MBD3417281.1 sulfatase-like hydrolase/transferase [Candidatus Altiarchaeales archaeon]